MNLRFVSKTVITIMINFDYDERLKTDLKDLEYRKWNVNLKDS